MRGYRTGAERRTTVSGTDWKVGPERVTAPYATTVQGASRHLSNPEHEKFRANYRGPSRKAKYYRETDSEPVP